MIGCPPSCKIVVGTDFDFFNLWVTGEKSVQRLATTMMPFFEIWPEKDLLQAFTPHHAFICPRLSFAEPQHHLVHVLAFGRAQVVICM